MSMLHVMPQPDGSELIRMARPKDWDYARWCTEPACEAECHSVYGWQEAGTATMIGWRPACGRKHALSIWHRELETN
jgi:hypothetical protein